MIIFEVIMLLCFGAAWPFSVYKSYKSKTNKGKSVYFMMIIFLGYVSGIIHKYFFNYDEVIILYVINAVVICADIILFFVNKRHEKINS
ncbi:MAG: hypothetical protein HRO68_10140 [Nitrosopumilus sp.]|nr:hypothetical protein [Nitrosopumilus sp.]